MNKSFPYRYNIYKHPDFGFVLNNHFWKIIKKKKYFSVKHFNSNMMRTKNNNPIITLPAGVSFLIKCIFSLLLIYMIQIDLFALKGKVNDEEKTLIKTESKIYADTNTNLFSIYSCDSATYSILLSNSYQ